MNENGEPLAGATVTVKGTGKGTSTNANGEFILKDVPNGKYLVEVSFVGYEKQEIKVNVHSFLTITLKGSTNPLDEVQIIAYGTTTKRLNTGNVSTVKAKEIEQQPVSNPLLALKVEFPD